MRFLSLGRIYLNYILKRPDPSNPPHRLWVEPTNQCNLKCIICPTSIEDNKVKKGFMDLGLYKGIIDEASGFAYDINLFHRGEPLLHPKIYEMITYASKKGLKTRLHTNATILTEENTEKVFDSGLHYISFSFDGYEKATYEEIRKGASFERTYNNILGFLRKKKMRGSNRPFIVIQVIESWDESRETRIKKRRIFMEAFKSLPLDKVSIRRPHNWGGSYGEGYRGGKMSSLCTFPWYSLTVFWDGEVVPCPQDFYGNLQMGYIQEGGIKEIWRGDRLISHRKALISGLIEGIEPCQNCDMLRRKTLMGVPINYLTTFLRENL